VSRRLLGATLNVSHFYEFEVISGSYVNMGGTSKPGERRRTFLGLVDHPTLEASW
jgi:hypothetical protein